MGSDEQAGSPSLEVRAGEMRIEVGEGSKGNRFFVDDISQSTDSLSYLVELNEGASGNVVNIKPTRIYRWGIKTHKDAEGNEVNISPDANPGARPYERGLLSRLFHFLYK